MYFSACATRLNSQHKTRHAQSLHRESLRNSKSYWINQQLPQAAKPSLSASSARNVAKLQRPNGYLGKGNFISRYGQHVTPAAQPNTPKKNFRPVQMHQVPSAQYTSNEAGHLLSNAKANDVYKSSPLKSRVPNISEAGIVFF